MHFDTKSYLKNTRNHTANHAISLKKKRKEKTITREPTNAMPPLQLLFSNSTV